MSTFSRRPSRVEPTRARPEALASRLDRFPRTVRGPVAALAARHSRLADLAWSYPGLLVALACPRRGFDPSLAVQAVIAGRKLTDVTRLAGVPLWLRRLPPEAFEGRIGPLPDGEVFRLRVANVLPKPHTAAHWLRHLSDAFVVADADFALWLAGAISREPQKFRPVARGWKRQPPLVHALRRMAVWAWFSRRPETMAGALIERRWSPDIGLSAARDASREWWSDLGAYFFVGDGRPASSWLRPGSQDGYDFMPLDSAALLIGQGKAQENCIRDFDHFIAAGCSRLWRVEKDGVVVGTLSIGFRGMEGLCQVEQLRGFRNRRLPAEVWMAAAKWLRTADPVFCTRPPEAPVQQGVWRRIWRPYWLGKQAIPTWLPLRGTLDVAFEI